MLRILSIALIVALTVSQCLRAEDPVFSGPQLGESLPAFQIVGVSGEQKGKPLDLIEKADGGPIMIVFFHELTRPGFGLMRALTNFAGGREPQGMTVGVVFLTDDMTETTKWASNVQRMFSDKVTYGVSPDGKEGPGAYGLNRNVTLTILVGNEGKVTANFALVQPQLEADGPAIAGAVVAVTGGGEIPSMAELDTRYGNRMNMQRGEANREMAQQGGRGQTDPRLGAMLRAVINRQANDEEVKEAAAKVEAYISENELARKELRRIVNTVINSGKLENYGTATAQEILSKWQAELGDDKAEDGAPERRPESTPRRSTGDDREEV